MGLLVHATYLCTAPEELREPEVLTLLRQSRIANRKHDVTGMLLYVGGIVLQAFEGDARSVTLACSTLYRDKPRLRLTQLSREPVSEREFPEWTMGFSSVDRIEAGQMLGDDALFGSAAAVARLSGEDAKTLLSIYGRRRYQADRSGLYRALSGAASSRH